MSKQREIGDYWECYERLKFRGTEEDTLGQLEPSYNAQEFLWGFSSWVTVQRVDDFGVPLSQARVRIVLNGKPELDERDQLKDQNGQLYDIDGRIQRTRFETIVMATARRGLTEERNG